MNKILEKQTILLLGNYRPTIILARNFTQIGYYVISGLEGCDGGAEYSNSVNEIWDHPPIASEPEKFITAFNDYVKIKNIDLIFPVSEDFVRFFGINKHLKLSDAKLISMDFDLVNTCLDKIKVMVLAKECQIPIATFARVEDHPELIKTALKIGYPLVIRPENSTIRIGNKKALFLKNESELLEHLCVWPKNQSALILQREAKGRRHNIYFAAKGGHICRYLHAVILRTDATDGSGLAVEGITIEPMATLRNYSTSLIRELDYSGIGCIQFLVDETDGNVSFLEINARIAGNHAVPEYAGLALGEFMLDIALGNQIDTHDFVGKAGIKYVWTSGDIQGTKISWLNNTISTQLALKLVFKAIKAAITSDLHMVFSISDPKPGLMALKDQFPNLWKLSKNLKNRR